MDNMATREMPMQSLDENDYGYNNPMEVSSDSQMNAGGLLELIDKILDKGLVINGDVSIAFAGVELLSLRINLVLASLETAKKYGIELPWEKWSNSRQTPEISADSQQQPGLPDGSNEMDSSDSSNNSFWMPQEQPPAYNKVKSQNSRAQRNPRKKLAKSRNSRSNAS